MTPQTIADSTTIFLGYLAKKLAPRPDWLACPNVEFVASVSECIAPAPPDRIDRWEHNHLELYDSESLAKGIIPREDLREYIIFAYHALPRIFHDGKALDWYPMTNFEAASPTLDDPFDEHLGFDIVGYTNGGFFECSPLSCNGVAKEIAVNRFCLVDDVQQAMDLAKDFSKPESRVEPAYGYIVVSIGQRRERK